MSLIDVQNFFEYEWLMGLRDKKNKTIALRVGRKIVSRNVTFTKKSECSTHG